MGFLLTTIVEVKTRMHRCTIVALDGTALRIFWRPQGQQSGSLSLSLSKMVCVEGRNLPNTWKPIFRCLIVCKKMAQVLLRTGFPTHTIHYSQAQSCKALPRVQTSSQLGDSLSWRTECYIGCWWHSEECLYCHNLLLCDGIIKGLKDGILRGGNLMKFGYMI